MQLEHRAELRLAVPVRQFCAIEQHHARRHAVVDEPFVPERARAMIALPCMSRDSSSQMSPTAKISGSDDHGATLIAHQLRRHEPQRRERLQVVVQPDAFDAVAQVHLAFVFGAKNGWSVRVDDLHVELVGVARIPAQRVLRDDRADDLFGVAVNENAVVHVVTSLHSRGPRCCNSRSADRASCR